MMKFHFSDGARAVLYSLGWTESRKVDVSDVVANLARSGYVPHSGALLILESFFGICVDQPGAFWVDFTNPTMVGGIFLQEELVELNPSLFSDLYPIGTISLSCLFVSQDGTIFSVDCDRYSWSSLRSIERLIDVMLRLNPPTLEEQYRLL